MNVPLKLNLKVIYSSVSLWANGPQGLLQSRLQTLKKDLGRNRYWR
jgi:hypothetical protein